ncbi:hypothetical protein GCM10022381_07790 [Leifsonia kafniensis]|uniref:Mucin-associated surface protein n=1 Tax=Leifsonia kafniensis TaxID=475957 RepID=A0ABP7K5N5_9MICO
MTRLRFAATATALALALGLGGCAGSPPGITAGTSDLMQSTVAAAANQAAVGDATGALATLDSLQSQLDQATTTGDISTERAAAIQQTIDQVRSDLRETTVPETIAPEPEPEAPESTVDSTVPETPQDTGDNGNNGNGKGNNGNGKSNNGNGNGKNK